jgi:hypothetical protein
VQAAPAAVPGDQQQGSADTLPDDLSSLNFFLTIWANLQNTRLFAKIRKHRQSMAEPHATRTRDPFSKIRIGHAPRALPPPSGFVGVWT